MRFIKMFLILVTMLAGTAAMADDVVYSDVQCWAEGNTFRVNGNSNKEQLTSTRFAMSLKEDGEALVMTGIIGHVSAATWIDGQKKLELPSFYSQIARTDIKLASSLSPRAKKYPDDKYWRFKDLEQTASTSHDGGGLNGYLVISKKLSDKEVDTFDAHFVFQHGDHTGGTIDLTCARE